MKSSLTLTENCWRIGELVVTCAARPWMRSRPTSTPAPSRPNPIHSRHRGLASIYPPTGLAPAYPPPKQNDGAGLIRAVASGLTLCRAEEFYVPTPPLRGAALLISNPQ